MKRILGLFFGIILALGMGLSCSGNKTPSAPSSTPTPTITPCVDSLGHTCTPTATATATSTITPGPLSVTAPMTLTEGGYAYTTVDIANGETLYINGAVTIDTTVYFNL